MKLSEEKRHAYKLRQKDTGWGRALASWIVPFYNFYYAVTRRTITPLAYGYLIGLSTWFIVILIAEAAVIMISPILIIGSFVSLIGTKLGIDRSRNYARMCLETEDSNQPNPFNGLDKISDRQPPMALDQGILAFARRRGVRGFTFNDAVLELGHSPEEIRLQLEGLMQKDCLHVTNDIEGRVIYREP